MLNNSKAYSLLRKVLPGQMNPLSWRSQRKGGKTDSCYLHHLPSPKLGSPAQKEMLPPWEKKSEHLTSPGSPSTKPVLMVLGDSQGTVLPAGSCGPRLPARSSVSWVLLSQQASPAAPAPKEPQPQADYCGLTQALGPPQHRASSH